MCLEWFVSGKPLYGETFYKLRFTFTSAPFDEKYRDYFDSLAQMDGH